MNTKTQKLNQAVDRLLEKSGEISDKLYEATARLNQTKAAVGAEIVSGGDPEKLSGQVGQALAQVTTLEAAKVSVDDQLAVARSELWESERVDASDKIRELDKLSDELENEIIGLLETVAEKGQILLNHVEEFENLENKFDVHPGYNHNRGIAGGFKASALAAIQEHGYRRSMRQKALAGEL